MSGSPSIFLISSKYRPNYLVRSTIFLSAAQENSVFLPVFARNQEIRDCRTSSILKILSGSLQRDVMISIQCLVCRVVVKISIANIQEYIKNLYI